MGPRIGLIAGSGDFPLLVLDEAKKKGLFCAVLGVKDQAPATLERKADAWGQIGPGQAMGAADFFRGHDIKQVFLVGKIDPAVLFQPGVLDDATRALWQILPDKRPSTVIRKVIDFFSTQGLQVLSPEPFLQPFFCDEGPLTASEPSPRALEDIEFGWPLARTVADLDIGQTIVVMDQAVVAVEGLEGTDEAIRRGGRLAGPGTVVLKVGRTLQDLRVDVPAVGLATARSLAEAGAAALCLEARKVAFFQRQEAVALAESSGVALLARKG